MSYFNRNKWWGIAFLLLILLNIATLSAFWLMRDKQPRPPLGGDSKSCVVDFMVKELDFDSAQKKQLIALREVYRQKMHGVRRNNRDAKNAFFALLQQPVIADTALASAAKAAVAFDIETDMLTFRHFQEVRKLCTGEQKKKFDEVIQEVLRMMAPPPPGNRQGPPPPDDRRGPSSPPGE